MKHKITKALALLLCFCFLLGPTASVVFADDNSRVISGYYDENDNWQPGEGPGYYVINDNTTLTLNKTAEPTENVNEYTITLTAVVRSAATIIPADSAATVLVIDTSGSMNGCASCRSRHVSSIFYDYYVHADGCPCGNGTVAEKDSRMHAAKQAALSFLNEYKGENVSNRYTAVVVYHDLATKKCDWCDITTEEGLATVESAIGTLTASGGSNMQQGLQKAIDLFNDETIDSAAKYLRNVVLLTDGAPTYYGTRPSGSGSEGSFATNNATIVTANDLKNRINHLYTVCYGAKNENCYSGGPKVGDFLKNNISNGEGYAFDAESLTELNAAFANITETIVQETENASGAYVIDTMPENITPSVVLEDGQYIWMLEDVDPVIEFIDDVVTYVYTYTTSYTVTIDADAQGFDESAFYPANGRTTLVWGDNSFDFPVPGIKGTTSRFTVTYQQGDHGSLAGNQSTVTYEDIKKWSATVTEDRPTPEVNPAEGFQFVGWSPAIDDVVTGDATYTAQYEPVPDDPIEHKVTFNANGHGTAPDEQTVADGDTATEPAAPTEEGWTFQGWYQDANGDVEFSFTTPIKADIILYAKWTEDKPVIVYHTVTFDGNGHGTPPDQVTVEHGQPVGCPSDPQADEGWEFAGWCEDQEGTTAYNFSKQVLEDITIFACWREKGTTPDPITFTVTFDANGHGTAPDDQTVEEGETATKPEAPTAEGWKFGGWYTEAACETEYEFATAITDNITLYAKWTAIGGDPTSPQTGYHSHGWLWIMLTALMVLCFSVLIGGKKESAKN